MEVPGYATVEADTAFVVSKEEAVSKKWIKDPKP
jgi:hypothetical protein